MNTDDELNELSEKIIGCAFVVHNKLGYGFFERVYENALAHELRKRGMSVEQQWRVLVMYDGVEVGEYIPDLVVEKTVVIELKSVKAIDDSHIAQCLNHLAVTKLPLCLLLNFGRRVDVKRFRGTS